MQARRVRSDYLSSVPSLSQSDLDSKHFGSNLIGTATSGRKSCRSRSRIVLSIHSSSTTLGVKVLTMQWLEDKLVLKVTLSILELIHL